MTLDIKKHKTPINPHHITIPKLYLLDIDNIQKQITADNLQNIISRDPKADPNINYTIIDESITEAIKMFSKSKTAKLNRRKHKLSKWITKGL